jgi:hypothetical protein
MIRKQTKSLIKNKNALLKVHAVQYHPYDLLLANYTEIF